VWLNSRYKQDEYLFSSALKMRGMVSECFNKAITLLASASHDLHTKGGIYEKFPSAIATIPSNQMIRP